MIGLLKKITICVCLFGSMFSAYANKEGDKECNKTVFITGGAGFMGSSFLEYMFKEHPDYHFIVLDNMTYAANLENIPDCIRNSDRLEFIQGSITDMSVVDPIMDRSHFVVHFAAETHVTRSIHDGAAFFDTNVMGTYTLIKSLVKHRNTVERFIHISSSEVYGTAEYVPMDEAHPLNPRSPYAASKAGAERLVYAYSCTYDIPTVIVRPFNYYGPKQNVEKMIPRFITSALENQPLTIHGTGEQVRDWVHTHDASVAIDRILQVSDFSTLKNQEINLASQKPISTIEIAKMILKHFDLPESKLVHIKDRLGQVNCHYGSNQKAKKLLDWTPSTDFRDGLEKTIAWYKDHPSYWGKDCAEEMDQLALKEELCQ